MIIYVVNEEKKKVCAYMPDCRQDFINYVYNCGSVNNDGRLKFIADIVSFDKLAKFPDKFFAVATCDDRDDFDPEIGKEIAKAKLLVKYYNTRARFIRSIYEEAIEYFNKFAESLQTGYEVALQKVEDSQNYVDDVNQIPDHDEQLEIELNGDVEVSNEEDTSSEE